MIILVKLFLAHFLGDFLLQPSSWVADKEEKKLKSSKLYLHAIIHAALVFLLLWDINLWYLAILIGATHLIIDGIKVSFQNKKNKRILFFIDQLVHLFTIVLIWYLTTQNLSSIAHVFNQDIFLVVTCVFFLTTPTSIILKTFFTKWNIKKIVKGSKSLKNAGSYIGILERLLVFLFIIGQHWEAVGFLITAKSVLRFSDVKAAKQRRLTEYILIGTLISFGIAIITGLVYNSLY